MTLLDSIDSILMLYSYSGFPERSFSIFEPLPELQPTFQQDPELHAVLDPAVDIQNNMLPAGDDTLRLAEAPFNSHREDVQEPSARSTSEAGDVQGTLLASNARDAETNDTAQIARVERMERQERVKSHLISGLSIVLTIMSIVVAFRYLTCAPCRRVRN
jgi:nickel/cobalt transporter (NiCoT) family protein